MIIKVSTTEEPKRRRRVGTRRVVKVCERRKFSVAIIGIVLSHNAVSICVCRKSKLPRLQPKTVANCRGCIAVDNSLRRSPGPILDIVDVVGRSSVRITGDARQSPLKIPRIGEAGTKRISDAQ